MERLRVNSKDGELEFSCEEVIKPDWKKDLKEYLEKMGHKGEIRDTKEAKNV